MEDPALAKGIVERDVIRIITPGTVTASSMLEENKSNYLCAVYLNAQSGGTQFAEAVFDAIGIAKTANNQITVEWTHTFADGGE